jgi:HK97 family phage portal protein
VTRILRADGSYAPGRERAWPMAGLNNPTRSQNGRSTVRLATRPGGPPDLATYYRIYRNNPWVYACVNTITLGMSRLSLNVYQYDNNGQGDFDRVFGMLPGSVGRPSAGAALDKLLQMPEPGVGRHEWLRKVWLDKLVYGNALVIIDRENGTIPTALWHVPWRRIVIHAGERVPIERYEVQADGGSKFYDPSEVIHFGRGNNIDSPLGHSPIEALRYTAALHDALQRHLVAYFENSARPSGVLKIQPGTNKDNIALMQENIEKLYASPEQAGKIMVTSADFQAMSADPQSSSIVQLAELSREEICAVYRVPPPVVGILTRAIKSNVVELRSQFVRDVVGPEADNFESTIMAQLVWQTPAWQQAGLFINFDLDSPLRPDLEARSVTYQNLRGVLTANEMRRMELRKPLTGLAGPYADTVSLPSGQVFLGVPQPQMDPINGNQPGPQGTEPAAAPTDSNPAPDAAGDSTAGEPVL